MKTKLIVCVLTVLSSVGICPESGELIWAKGHKGPAYNLNGNFTGHQTE